jgi:uncharacterized protein YPO0396
MIELCRIILVDWYLFRAQQIDLRGMTALIGPNGAGKSAVIDAVQTVLTGANMSNIRFNPSAQSGTRSKRSIRDYCLGVVSLDDKGERSEPTRSHAYTYVVLGFRDEGDGSVISLGVAFSASAERGDERCEARFLVRGHLVGSDDLLHPVGDDDVETAQWHAVRNALRGRGVDVEDGFSSATEFVEESLHALSPPGFPLSPRRFIKAFRNALLLKPVDNPTDFVRNYVLDVQPIQVDRLRRSIDHWRFLNERIDNLKKQSASLAQILRIVARVKDNERAILSTEWRIARLHWETFRRNARELEARLAKMKRESSVAEAAAVAAAARLSRIEAEHARVELTIKSSVGAQLASMYEADRTGKIAERVNAAAPIGNLEHLIRTIDAIVDRRLVAGRDDILHGLLSSVVLANGLAALARWRTTMPDGWERQALDLDRGLDAVTGDRLAAAQKIFDEGYFAAQLDVRNIQDRIDLIDSNLARLDQGLSAIEGGTRALLRQLEFLGISAEPLCDLVEVRDSKWRAAAEAVLGRSREALIVESGQAVRAMDAYRSGGDDAYRGAEVVNTTKTQQTRPADKGSLATVIATANPHARAFLDYRLGRLMMVETMDRAVTFENAITPDRMMNSGRTVKRMPHPEHLKLGRSNAEETRRLLLAERGDLVSKLAEKARASALLKEERDLIDAAVREFEQLRRQGISATGVGRELAKFDGLIASITASIDDAQRHRDPELLKELDRLNEDRASAAIAKTLADKAWHSAHAIENQAVGQYERLIQENHDRLRTERRAKSRAVYVSSVAEMDMAEFEPRARAVAAESIPGEIEGLSADCRRRIDERRPQLNREMTTAVLKHHHDFHVSLPFSDDQATAEVVGSWASTEKQRLDSHELVQYEDQCRNAAGEMTAAFRDDLLHRLHDAFEGIREMLAELNRHLKDRKFHGRDYYVFRSSVAATHADMIELVQESRRPDFELPLFGDRSKAEAATPALRAVRRIEEILSNPEAKTEEIEDPRKYFNFELYVQDEQGKIRSSLSSRAGTGSGGEGQLPFYIAIGASLAATYQNRRTGESGLSLAVFDEAFNRLDTEAIGACSDFMKALGLQVVLASPDEKRHVFMEVVDTVVNVNRLGNEVMIDTEHLTDKAREVLAAADPYRKGFDKFKAELLAAEARSEAIASARDEAAE